MFVNRVCENMFSYFPPRSPIDNRPPAAYNEMQFIRMNVPKLERSP